MSYLVQPRLVNGPFEDPGLFVDFRYGDRALLFDLGDIGALSPRELGRVTHVFVSHAHLDHFYGFDRLFRLSLRRTEQIGLIGPPDFIDRVGHRIAGYTWNLLDENSADFGLLVGEFDGERITRSALFRAREGFRCREVPPPDLPPGMVLEEPDFCIRSTRLDHRTASLAFVLQERLRVNVIRQELESRGLPVGRWIDAVKTLIRTGAEDGREIAIRDRTVRLGDIRGAFRVAPGRRVAYVVDACPHEENAERIEALVAGADQLFIETAFLDADAELARDRCHMTARHAGRLARAAGVKRVTGLHFSTRYVGREAELRAELAAAFSGR